MTYKTKGVCAQGIEFEIDDNKKVHNVRFIGGCSGNTQGVATNFMSGSACKGNPSGIKRRLICKINRHPAESFFCRVFFIFVSSVRYLFCPIYHTMTGYLLQNGPDLCLGSLHSYG